MALWNGLGQAATLAQLAGVDAGGLMSLIIDAVKTVQRNKEECRQLAQDAMLISGFMQLFQQLQMMRFPMIRVLLVGLEDTLRQVYELVTSCQKRNIMYSFFMAGNQAQKFRDVRDRINFYLQAYPVISHIHTTYFLSGIYSRVDPSGIQPQALEEVLKSFASHPNPDSRSGINSEMMMSTTGSEVPFAPLSGITEFTLSTLVATTQHFPKESITEGGGYYQLTVSVIQISILCKKMAILAEVDGVSSICIAEDEDKLKLIGQDMDADYLRRKLGLGPVELQHMILIVIDIIEAIIAEVDAGVSSICIAEDEDKLKLKPANMRRRARSRGGFRAILTKLFKFMGPCAHRSVSPPPPSRLLLEHTDNPAPAASGGPSSHLFSAASTSTAASAASPPACTQVQLAHNPSASAQRQDLSRAADLPPVRVAAARRRRRAFYMSSRVRVSARPAAARRQQTAQRVQGNASSSSNAGGTDDGELAAVEAGCGLEEYVAMFDGPMPPAVISALAGAAFHLDGEDGIRVGNAVIEHGTAEMR